MNRSFLLIAIVCSLAAGTSSQSRAGLIYIEGSSSALGTLDPTTGAINVIGPTSVLLYGLGFDSTGNLYGLGQDHNLYAVNTTTAAETLIGAYTGNFNGGASMGSSSDGTLYATNGGGDVWTVDKTSGAATLLGNIGVSTNSNLSGDGGSGLFITAGNELLTINRVTGTGTLVGPGSYGEVFGLAFTNNALYAIEAGGTGIYSLNLTNGNSTLVSNYDHGVLGQVDAAAAIKSLSPVPEPSSIVLFGLGGFALVPYGWRRARRSRPDA